MSIGFKIFGLSVESNCSLPGLDPVRFESPHLSLSLGSAPSPAEVAGSAEELAYTSVIAMPSGEPLFRLFRNASGVNHVIYNDGAQFWLDAAGGRVWAT